MNLVRMHMVSSSLPTSTGIVWDDRVGCVEYGRGTRVLDDSLSWTLVIHWLLFYLENVAQSQYEHVRGLVSSSLELAPERIVQFVPTRGGSYSDQIL